MRHAPGRLRRLRLPALLLIFAAAIGVLLFRGVVVPDVMAQPSTATHQTTQGIDNDADMWRAVREGIRGRVSIPDQKAAQLIQYQGQTWRDIRNGPLVHYGAYLLAAAVVVLAIFFFLRGRIRVDGGFSGHTITRFGAVERFAHWLVAVSFIVLGLTGLNVTFGRYVLLPVIGKSAFATISVWAKYAHNYVAFAFIAGLILIFISWVAENIPNKYDIRWLTQAGGMFSKGAHPPAKKFNAGQKILFWLIILGGSSLVASGLDLLFPFQMAMFSKTFAALNLLGASLPTDLAPIHEMQLASIWHATVALLMIALILGHIYIGTLGMEGAFDAMGTGEVDVNWAREHHPLWVDELAAKTSTLSLEESQGVAPAE